MMDGAALRSFLYSGLVLLAGLQLSSGEVVYVRRGDNITNCSMKCPHREGVLQMYRICGGDEAPLLELWCNNITLPHNHYGPRLHLDPSSGCWTLRNAVKNDSCVYNMVYDNGTRSLTTLPITVLDPVLLSNITSNSSRPGEDIAVTVQFSGEEAAVTWEVDGGLLPDRYRLIDDNRTVIIPRAQRDDAGRRLHVQITNPVSEETQEHQLEITDPAFSGLISFPGVYVAVGIVFPVMVAACIALLVTCRCRKKTKTEDVERSTEENKGPVSSSQTDRPAEEEAETREKSFLIRIHKIWGRIMRRGYVETRQSDGAEMDHTPSAAAAETRV